MHTSTRIIVGALLMAATWSVTAAPAATAQTRCPASMSGCTVESAPTQIRDRVNDGAKRVLTNPDGVGRVREVGRTVRDCANCGMEALKDGAGRLKGSGGASK